MEEKIFVGYGYGRFETNKGQMQNYCNVFVLEDFAGSESNDYRFGGQKAAKYRCTSPDVWKDCAIGSRVRCFFDSRNRISYMTPVESSK